MAFARFCFCKNNKRTIIMIIKLDLSSCSGLTVLPESMGRLTGLQELRECVVYWYSILLSKRESVVYWYSI